MESQEDSGRRNEIEYLAALIAFKDELIHPVELRHAVSLVTSGASPSLLTALRASENVEPSALAAAEREARLYLNLPPMVEERTRLARQMPATAPAQFVAAPEGHGEPLATSFDEITELPDESVAEEFEWKPTSEVWSHVYYIEDTLRS